MRYAMQSVSGVLGAILLGPIAHGAEAPESDGQPVEGIWQAHKANISYVGFTTRYTCSGLEDHVRAILVSLGARKDAKVHATGCPYGPDRPSSTAWINAEFSTLAPADNVAVGTDVVKAIWAPREITPQKPYFMGEGDCELIEQMKDTISSSFAFRGLEYRADCVPHQIVINGFKVKGSTLVPAPAARGGAKSH